MPQELILHVKSNHNCIMTAIYESNIIFPLLGLDLVVFQDKFSLKRDTKLFKSLS